MSRVRVHFIKKSCTKSSFFHSLLFFYSILHSHHPPFYFCTKIHLFVHDMLPGDTVLLCALGGTKLSNLEKRKGGKEHKIYMYFFFFFTSPFFSQSHQSFHRSFSNLGIFSRLLGSFYSFKKLLKSSVVVVFVRVHKNQLFFFVLKLLTILKKKSIFHHLLLYLLLSFFIIHQSSSVESSFFFHSLCLLPVIFLAYWKKNWTVQQKKEKKTPLSSTAQSLAKLG